MCASDPVIMESETLMVEADNMEVPTEDMKKSSSRFQVARVDSQCDRRGSGDQNCEDEGQSGPESPGGARFSFSTQLSQDSFQKTCGWNDTHEAIPREDNYRHFFSAEPNIGLRSRPTLAELHEELEDADMLLARKCDPLLENREADPEVAEVEAQAPVTHVKFGWIEGVFMRAVLNIFGVMIFIRLAWVVAHDGILIAIGTVIVASAVTTITSISMSAICTNGEVRGGGAYFMISRCMGPEFGCPIGLIYSVANAVAAAMYIVGAAETAATLMRNYGVSMSTFQNDVRIISVITLVLLASITSFGMKWESRAQFVLMVILVVAIANFFIGTCIPPNDEKRSKGVSGYSAETFRSNILWDFRYGESAMSVFAVFFPAATGILAGANISGDLKDPQTAIPKGTLLAIAVTSATYMLICIMLGSVVQRDANGILFNDLLPRSINGTVAAVAAVNVTGGDIFAQANVTLAYDMTTVPGLPAVVVHSIDLSEYVLSNQNVANCSMVAGGCKYGLFHDYQIMAMVSGWWPLITAGIFSATLSSALASMVSAPKVFHAVCKDNIFKWLNFFAPKSEMNMQMPRRAFALTLVVALGFCLIGDLNEIAPLISLFFLATYALINLACWDSSSTKAVGWRPAFKWYNKHLSLFGFILCVVVMAAISPYRFIIVAAVIIALVFYVKHTKPEVNWGSSVQAHVYRKALKFTQKLLVTDDHVKNYRPQFLVLTGEPENRPALVDFVGNVTKDHGLLVCGNVIVGEQYEFLSKLHDPSPYIFFKARKVKAFYTCTTAPTYRRGVQSLLQNVGVGKFKPNILLMGFKSNWQADDPDFIFQYFMTVHDAFDLEYGVGILRLPEGLGMGLEALDATIFNDPNDAATDEDVSDNEVGNKNRKKIALPNGQHSMTSMSNGNRLWRKKIKKQQFVAELNEKVAGGTGAVGPLQQVINAEVIRGVNRFNIKQNKSPRGNIDVWWLHDDGGLTLLVPHLLKTKTWKKCPMRVFTQGTKKGEIDSRQRELVTLIQKFRIDAKDVEVVPELNKSPSDSSMEMFHKYLDPYIIDESKGETKEQFPWKSTQEEVHMLHDKTKRQVRLRELMLERSHDAALIVATLPMPRKGGCSACMYMCWLDTLTRDMPPILLLRGNQQSVLTFYS